LHQIEPLQKLYQGSEPLKSDEGGFQVAVLVPEVLGTPLTGGGTGGGEVEAAVTVVLQFS